MVTKLISWYCGACLVESNISDANWLRYLFSSYLIKIWLSVWHHHSANLHNLKTCHEYLWNKKRYLKKVNSVFQNTCLCCDLNLFLVLFLLNQFKFFKLVHIFQTGLKFLNQFFKWVFKPHCFHGQVVMIVGSRSRGWRFKSWLVRDKKKKVKPAVN